LRLISWRVFLIPFIETYEELNISEKAREKFEAAIERAKKQKANGIEEILSRIVGIGKG